MKERIVEIINELLDQYTSSIVKHDLSGAIDIHDEITRWLRELLDLEEDTKDERKIEVC